ncbi:hypothetical protein PBN151_5456 [Paenibacillus sp. NAIST15-1]|nr:hypothetical protein PBN151_5456 [Paenibacillus sp. NAIST15-1]
MPAQIAIECMPIKALERGKSINAPAITTVGVFGKYEILVQVAVSSNVTNAEKNKYTIIKVVTIHAAKLPPSE